MSNSIKLYNVLLDRNFSKEEAETVVSELENLVDRKFETSKDTLATKEDLHKAISDLKRDMSDNTNKVIIWVVGLIFGQTGLIFLILQLVGVFN